MLEDEQTLYTLVLIGALIAIAKILGGNEPITIKLLVSRIILGCAVTLIAGASMLYIPNAGPLTILGIGSVLGLLGYQIVEILLHRLLSTEKKEGGNLK